MGERGRRKGREERHIGIIGNHDIPEIILFFSWYSELKFLSPFF